jgi:hypothetical protein
VAVVVGYVLTKEGRAALRRASEESLLRRTKLIVINSSRGGKDFDAGDARRFEAALIAVQGQLDKAGVEHEVRLLVRGNDPAQDLIEVADEVNADFFHRDRPAQTYSAGQAGHGVKRPAHPARRLLSGARRQGWRQQLICPTAPRPPDIPGALWASTAGRCPGLAALHTYQVR